MGGPPKKVFFAILVVDYGILLWDMPSSAAVPSRASQVRYNYSTSVEGGGGGGVSGCAARWEAGHAATLNRVSLVAE